jgi:hypothetical protein
MLHNSPSSLSAREGRNIQFSKKLDKILTSEDSSSVTSHRARGIISFHNFCIVFVILRTQRENGVKNLCQVTWLLLCDSVYK